ncbi:MAG: hypothetical protein U0903_10210 [Planctomycetales bacterium]
MNQAMYRALLYCTFIVCLCTGCALSGGSKKTASTDTKKAPPRSSKTEVAATPFWRRPFGSSASKSSTASKDKPASKSKSTIASRGKNTRKETSTETAQASREKPGAQEKDSDVEKTSDKSLASSTLDGFDETTRALIQSELREADPETREEMLRELKGVPPEMVPRILNTWRLGAKYQNQAKKDKVTPVSGKKTAARDDSPEKADAWEPGAKKTPDAGLGSQNPWNANYTPGANQNSQVAAPPATAEAAANAARNSPTGNKDSMALAQQMAAAMGANTPGAGLSRQATPANGVNNPFAGGGSAMNLLGNAASPNGSGNPVQLGQPLAAVEAAAWAATQQQTGIAQQGFTPNPSDVGQISTIPTTIPATTTAAPNSNAIQIPGSLGPNQLQQTVAIAPAMNPQTLEAVQKMISLKEAEVAQMTPGHSDAERQKFIEAHVHLRMLYMMAGQQQRALQSIPGIEPADQEFWQQVVWGMTNYFDNASIPNPSDRASQTVAQFQVAGNRLREKARLELRNLSFCNKIDGFGDFERYPHDEFSPGQQLLIYAEVVNFRSEITAEGKFRTLLKSSYEILRPGGGTEVLDHKKYDSIPDVCRNQRQDFYLNYETRLPQNLSPGPYILRLTVSDELAHKVTTQNINFTVR